MPPKRKGAAVAVSESTPLRIPVLPAEVLLRIIQASFPPSGSIDSFSLARAQSSNPRYREPLDKLRVIVPRAKVGTTLRLVCRQFDFLVAPLQYRRLELGFGPKQSTQVEQLVERTFAGEEGAVSSFPRISRNFALHLRELICVCRSLAHLRAAIAVIKHCGELHTLRLDVDINFGATQLLRPRFDPSSNHFEKGQLFDRCCLSALFACFTCQNIARWT